MATATRVEDLAQNGEALDDIRHGAMIRQADGAIGGPRRRVGAVGSLCLAIRSTGPMAPTGGGIRAIVRRPGRPVPESADV